MVIMEEKALEGVKELLAKRGKLRVNGRCGTCSGRQFLQMDGDYTVGAVWKCVNCGREESVF